MTDLSQLADRISSLTQDRASAPRLRDGLLTLVLDVSGLRPSDREAMEAVVRDVCRAEPGVRDVRIAMTEEKSSGPRIIAVGSGKGGVGKSTLSVNIAVALHRMGLRVGLVDADIYGPSLPKLLANDGVKPAAENSRMIPIMSASGVPVLSMGHLIPAGQAIAWRGPMAGNALSQLLDAHWGDTDILVVDLPPGTGDIQLSMIQKHKPAGAIIVSTPQDLALIDAARAMSFFDTAGVPIIGMVENMAGYVCPHCGELSDPFGHGGTEKAALERSLPFLGRVPLTIAIREASDAGTPPAAGAEAHAEPFAAIAARVAAWIDASAMVPPSSTTATGG